jgi:hypothetical protein
MEWVNFIDKVKAHPDGTTLRIVTPSLQSLKSYFETNPIQDLKAKHVFIGVQNWFDVDKAPATNEAKTKFKPNVSILINKTNY